MFENWYFESKWRRHLLAEFIGTWLLVMTASLCGALINDPLRTPLTIGAEVVGLTFVGAGTLNPALAVALTMVRIRRVSVSKKPGGPRLAVVQMLTWIPTQILGATIGALFAVLLLSTEEQRQRFPAPQPASSEISDVLRALLAEFFFTFQLVYIMLFTCVAKEYDRVNVNRFLGPGLGCIVFVGACAAGPISGAPVNPAAATALQLVQCMIRVGPSANECKPLSFLWLYWVAEISAAFVATTAFLFASNESDPSEFDEAVFVEEVRDAAQYTCILTPPEESGESVCKPVCVVQGTGEERHLLNTRTSDGRCSLIRRRMSSGHALPGSGGGRVTTLLDLE